MKLRCSLFDIGFIVYYISLFIDDLAISNTPAITKPIHYIAYIIFAFYVFLNNRSRKKHILIFLATVLSGLGISVLTHDIYWAVVALLVLASRNADSKYIIKISYQLLCILTIITMILLAIGVLPMHTNMRSGENIMRYGMGFYHSNVLPMIIFYLLIYRLLLRNAKLSTSEIVFWITFSVGIYTVCRGRNGLYGVLFCGVLLFIDKFCRKRKIYSKFSNLLSFIAKWLPSVLIVLSLIFALMQGMNLPSMYLINQMVTGRFAIAFHQIEKMGLYLISPISGEQYAKMAFVLDNGYLYTALRYGILFLLFYILIYNNLLKKYSSNNIVKIIIICVAITNMIDNDLYSYGFLPIILMSFSERPIIYADNAFYRDSHRGRI